MTKKLITYHHQQTKSEPNENILTKREKEMLLELTKGLSNKEIAEALFISDKTSKFTSIRFSKAECEKPFTGSQLCR